MYLQKNENPKRKTDDNFLRFVHADIYPQIVAERLSTATFREFLGIQRGINIHVFVNSVQRKLSELEGERELLPMIQNLCLKQQPNSKCL